MIRLNRTTEYGLMSLRHMYRAPDARVSAREIAGTYGLPFEITAKTLQRLKEHGFIRSEQGAKGGYTLNRALDQVSLAEFLEAMEGPQAVVGCAGDSQKASSNCEYDSKCEIKRVMGDLNSRVLKFLNGISVAELVDSKSEAVFAISPSVLSAPTTLETTAAWGEP